jgi:hypothetical protein
MLEDVQHWLQRLANFHPIDVSQEVDSRRSSRLASNRFDGENAAILLDHRQRSSTAAATVAPVHTKCKLPQISWVAGDGCFLLGNSCVHATVCGTMGTGNEGPSCSSACT